MSGYQLANQIRQTIPDLPVLMISGNAEELLENGNRDRSLPRLLQQPYKLDRLARAMAVLLANPTYSAFRLIGFGGNAPELVCCTGRFAHS